MHLHWEVSLHQKFGSVFHLRDPDSHLGLSFPKSEEKRKKKEGKKREREENKNERKNEKKGKKHKKVWIEMIYKQKSHNTFSIWNVKAWKLDLI